MRRTSTLVVDTTTTTLKYDLEASPRSSISSPVDLKEKEASKHPVKDASHLKETVNQALAIRPSILLLFSLLSRRNAFVLLFPAILSSLVAGGVAPFMTYVTGQAFGSFATFPSLSNPTDADKRTLLHGVGLASIELVALGVGSFVLSSITSALWIWTGERNVMALRQHIYQSVSEKELSWFDTKLGGESGESEGSFGAGGMMAKFSRETDDVRAATSLAAGYLIQYITTCLACLVLALMRSWSLTLVILSAVPALVIIQGVSQNLASPLLTREQAVTASAAGMLDRVVNAISTVKAFNAQAFEYDKIARSFDSIKKVTTRLNVVWGVTSSLSQFTSMAMFVQGFWFGSKLVREGKISPGDVMAVFWACLIATSNLQMCIPQFIAVTKGKFAMAELLNTVEAFSSRGAPASSTYSFRKIKPRQCHGEISLHNVTFTYPTAPEPILKDVTLFLPANETTFIVGSSGSGKSTIAALLMNMYTPEAGAVCLDDTDVRYIDERWLRASVCGIGQGWSDVILDGASIRDNVRLGLEGIGDKGVEDACRAALLHDFIRDLPEGYDTVLGGGVGVALSGGQRQRLAVARARLRNPPVLVLDEATSALDATSRLLVFEAIKTWRHNKTTIVITHDLSQIESEDFVYVMKNGRLVEQGFRRDLEQETPLSPAGIDGKTSEIGGRGEFRKMLDIQLGFGGFLPAKELAPAASGSGIVFPSQEEPEPLILQEERFRRHQTLPQPLMPDNWMVEAITDLTTPAPVHTATIDPARREITNRQSSTEEIDIPQRRPSTLHVGDSRGPGRRLGAPRISLPFTRPTPAFSTTSSRKSKVSLSRMIGRDSKFDYPLDVSSTEEKAAIHRDPAYFAARRQLSEKRRGLLSSKENMQQVTVQTTVPSLTPDVASAPSPFRTLATAYPTIPYKPLLFLGLAICILSGTMTPVFSFLLSRLFFETAIGAHNVSTINLYGGIVLGVAAFDGFLLGLKYFIMETSGMIWVTALRKRVLDLILKQDRSWFDKADNSAVRLVQTIVKDGDDARNLVAVVMGQCLVVISMLSVGLVWSLVRGWELTFVGFAIAPVFAAVMTYQTKLVAGCEIRNKKAREEVAKSYYEVLRNVKGIRAMAFEDAYQSRFDGATTRALSTGVKGAYVEGCTYGIASGLIYLSQALLFYVGAVLIAKGRYTYLQMVEVLNVVVFTVTIGSQLMAFTQRIAKSVQATDDFMTLLRISKNSPAETQGSFRPDLEGSISFNDVSFQYPERKENILRNINLSIAPGECVAIVGPSGSGKSTLAALLQRLYEPTSGHIQLGTSRLSDVDPHHLRQHISVVSQNPYLFDATVSENLKYGNSHISDIDVHCAAKAVNADDFVMGLSHGYDTSIGDNAGLISGGQAQRLAIARALARPSRILILDECTSALDPENQKAVIEAIGKMVQQGTGGRTTFMVTHKLHVMQMCDRIIVLDGGEVKEEGSYDELISKKGVFASLARSGEWIGD